MKAMMNLVNESRSTRLSPVFQPGNRPVRFSFFRIINKLQVQSVAIFSRFIYRALTNKIRTMSLSGHHGVVAIVLLLGGLAGCSASNSHRLDIPSSTSSSPARGLVTCQSSASPWNPLQDADRGIGGTGIMADKGMGGTGKVADKGMGGTGKVADKGMGGTGKVADKGLGGTGIVGVITGFGSICVNGVEIVYGEKTAVKMDGRGVDPASLRLGQVAAAFTRAGENGLEAGIIVVNHALTGIIDRVDVENRQLRMLGVVVDVPESAIIADLTGKKTTLAKLGTGDAVAVSGLWKPNGHVEATRVDQTRNNSGRVSATGLIKSFDDQRFVLSGIPVLLSRANVLESEAKGHTALVVGRWNGERIEAEKVELQPVTPFCVRAHDLNLEGYVTGVENGGNFKMLGTVRVVVGPDTEIIGADKISKGMRVWVHGPVRPNRLVNARQVRVLGW